ncbi:MAG: carboxylating nicotinate-nucleotide diphosphorylase [Chloroflexi bacterium]|nr:carboxylating nicotinate-nucleotide diphosphorylase [Chloroflexota bacterium]
MSYSRLPPIAPLVRLALAEDAAHRDATSRALIPPSARAGGEFLIKQEGVIVGLPIAQEVFRQVDPKVRFTALIRDGSSVQRGDVVAKVEGPLASILSAERVALNFMQRLSGTATLTARFVEAVKGTRCAILDTRKTTPGLRRLEKYAVRMGGGTNHRMDLSDGILVKDNHIAALRGRGWSLRRIVEEANRKAGGLPVVIEVTTIAMAREALDAGAKRLLLDNMSLARMRRCVALAKGKAKTEASGGMTLARVRSVARTGVDYISVGALTHSAPALDISLEVNSG